MISYLEHLVAALKSGAVRVHRGEEQIVLGPRGVVGFSLAASDKGKRQKLTLELSWRKFAAPDPELDLAIGPGEEAAPVAEEVAEEAAIADAATVAGAASVYTASAEGYTNKPVETNPVDADGKPQGTPAGAQGYEIGGGD